MLKAKLFSSFIRRWKINWRIKIIEKLNLNTLCALIVYGMILFKWCIPKINGIFNNTSHIRISADFIQNMIIGPDYQRENLIDQNLMSIQNNDSQSTVNICKNDELRTVYSQIFIINIYFSFYVWEHVIYIQRKFIII